MRRPEQLPARGRREIELAGSIEAMRDDRLERRLLTALALNDLELDPHRLGKRERR